jgi:hypothetical protein
MRNGMRWLRQHLILAAAVPGAAAVIVAGGAHYGSYTRFIVSTDDA